ncbi:ABC transporter permease [Antrihabitans sp. NCIMB 15449]|uniref:ABC transporter permease n=1 Tax=Antrihabitans spumae TaxID=3373370 RepID=A0ABW7JQ02_9NOCA
MFHDDARTATRAEAGPVIDNLPSYVSFGFVWLVGYGSFASSYGDDPIVPLPSAIPGSLLVVGLLAALVVTFVVTARAQRGAKGEAALVGRMLNASWLVGFGALFITITALAEAVQMQEVHALLWPTGSGVVVGMLYLAGGSAQRDIVQYTLGLWLALASSAALFLPGAGMYACLALAGGGGYFAAAALEPRRRRGSRCR